MKIRNKKTGEIGVLDTSTGIAGTHSMKNYKTLKDLTREWEDYNEKRRYQMKNKINWEKVVAFGVGLGFCASVLYLLLIIAASVAK